MAETFKVEGLKELEAALLEMEQVGAVDALKSSMMYATEPTLNRMKATVPVGDGKGKDYKGNPKTAGRLKSSIFQVPTTVKNSPHAASVYVGVLGKNAYYAGWVEYGTAPHYVNKGADRASGSGKVINKIAGKKGIANVSNMHPGAKPKPFVGPAFDATQETMLTRFKDKLVEDIDKYWKGK